MPEQVMRNKLAVIKAVDDTDHTVQAILSTEARDRDGDIIRQSGWDLGNFKSHPVLLSSHKYLGLQNQIGEWQNVKIDRSTKELVGTARYYVGEGNAEADWGFNLASKGRAAFSVGFIPDMAKAERIKGDDEDDWFPNFEFRGQELLEISHVTVPSNFEALQAIKSIGVPAALVRSIERSLDEEPPKKPWPKNEEDDPEILDLVDGAGLTDDDLDALAQRTIELIQAAGLLAVENAKAAPVAPILIRTSPPMERGAVIKNAVEKAIEEVLAR
jgi:hypothetical protein